MVTQIAYTNSNCSDVWKILIEENQKHTKLPLYIISDKLVDNFDANKQFIYNNKDPYYLVWAKAVEKFGGEYFIYLQEDFILYDKVNEEKINEYAQFLQTHPEYSFVRLLKSGNLYNKQLLPTLYEIESTNLNVFAMQATIWKSVDYIRLMNYVKSNGWLETDADYRSKMISLNMMGAYHYDNENKRGGSHYDSNVYPYIATALVRGKWDMKEYGNELNKILNEYKIDINKRGII